MRLSGRISAAIEILTTIEQRHIPASIALKDWGANNRFAGSSDRAAIGNLVYDALRKKSSLAYIMADNSARSLVLALVVLKWGIDAKELEQSFEQDNFAPSAISKTELERLSAKKPLLNASDEVIGNIPIWLKPSLKAAFGENFLDECKALSERPPLDLRVNSLQATADKVLKPLDRFSPEFSKILPQALRIKAGTNEARTPNVSADGAYKKGWFEIQDLGSQIVSALIGARAGEQVLDYCAGAGGKTLAIAGQMQNKGQIFAYDNDRNRLAPIYDRLKRNGVRNVQVIAPDEKVLENLIGRMDRVVVDAPCTGSGTWRRRADNKWKLSQKTLDERVKQQSEILAKAAKFVKLGGELTYITCSILPEENSEQIEKFLKDNPNFTPIAPDSLWQKKFGSASNAKPYFDKLGLTLTPASCGTDGFYISILKRETTA